MAVEFDTTELRKLSVDLGKAGPEVARQVDGIIRKGALTIKNDLQREAVSPSDRFSRVGASISYDVVQGRDGIEAEIGPEIGLPRGNPRAQGALAWIAYEGTSRSGPVFPDPQGALDREAGNVQEWIGRVAGGIL